MSNIKIKTNMQIRPPVVVILGHVDHGKTTLLDYIRQTRVAQTETAGITQHTGAYQVEKSGHMITFIDTPGHEAFSAMRSRGANVADIAILVVAADDGVMPQTKEAIYHIKHAGIPLIVAINKIDTQAADIQKVKNQLAEAEVFLEGYGGKVPNVAVSAKTGEGTDDLLDMINLVAELEELQEEVETPVEMVVIESTLDSSRGPVATFLVKKGILRVGDIIAGNTAWAKVKNIRDFGGNNIKEARPSTPVVVLGLSVVPQVGEKFKQMNNAQEAEERVERRERKEQEGSLVDTGGDKKLLNIILKADAAGTLEAVHEVLRSIQNEEVALRVLSEGTGDINDSDIRLAESGKAIIVGFRVKANNIAQNLARARQLELLTFDTIYSLVEGVRAELSLRIEEKVSEVEIGKLKVLAVFRTEANSMIVGGKVVSGIVRRGAALRVEREGEIIGEGRATRLQIGPTATQEAGQGEETGVLFEGGTKIQMGDILHFVDIKKEKSTL